MSNYNNIFEKQREKVDISSDITQITNNTTQLYLEDTNLLEFSQDFRNEIVKEMCNLYNEEILKCDSSEPVLEKLKQFLIKKKQNPVNIIDFCLDYQTNPTIQLVLASCYFYGKWVEKDEHKSFNYYQKSAEMNNSQGIYCLGVCYERGIGVEKDIHKAFIYYQKSAEMGNAKGTYNAGCCYRDGIGVEKDEYKAFIYYQKSAEMGNASGEYSVGTCYQYGIGVEMDYHKAFIYFQKSAEMGYAAGEFAVGICYRDGIGVEMDYHKAFIYFQKSAEMGYAAGTNETGLCYLQGKGVCKDEKIAFEYFKKAADMGYISAILQVGDCYRNGIGVPRDIQRANHWYRIERGVNKVEKLSYENIDDNLKQILDDEKYQLLWIPHNECQNIKEIGKGGFATVYYAHWLDKNRNYRTPIALKLIHGSNTCNQEFVEELKTYCEIGYDNPSFLKCYGISRDNKTNDYIIVLKYASKGSLRQNLKSVAQMKWKDKLNVLYSIASDLESIHSQELIHRDLHSGNILQDHLHSAYITDLGLSTSSNMKQKEGISGVMSYVAPEVLMGQAFTQAADIYSFGVIMYEVSTGRRAFDGEPFDTKLAVKICQGKRPEFDKGIHVPDCYIELAKECMDQDQNERPTATVIGGIICHWLYAMSKNSNNYNEIKKHFLDADKIELNVESPKHPDHIYTSKLINTLEITSKLDLQEIPNDS